MTSPPVASKASVLLVDDYAANLVALRAVLESLDAQLVEATSAREALALCKRQRFAVVLLDVQMPDVDGFELARMLRESPTGRHTPIVFLSAQHRGEEQIALAYEGGAADYFTKPFEPGVLRARVRAFVDLFRREEELRVREERLLSRERDDAQARLSAVLDEAELGIGLWDKQLCFVAINRALSTIHGLSENALGRSLTEALPELDVELIATMQHVLGTGTRAQLVRHFPLASAGGKLRHFNISYYPVHRNGELIGLGAVYEDITQRHSDEQRRERLLLREQRVGQRLRDLSEASIDIARAKTLRDTLQAITLNARLLLGAHDAVASTSPANTRSQGIVSRSSAQRDLDPASEKSNAQRELMRGPGAAELPGIEALVCGGNRALRLTQAELEAHLQSRGEEMLGGTAGLIAAPLVTRDGRSLGLIRVTDKQRGEFTDDDMAVLQQLARVASAALENIVLFELAEQERARAQQASNAKDEFLAMCSHELRTPLTAVLGWCQVLLTDGVSETQARKAAQTIERNAKAQVELIDDLFDVSRIITGKLRLERRQVDMRKIVQAALDAIRPAAGGKNVTIESSIDTNAAPVHGDSVRLQQIVWNLLTNAIKFSSAGAVVQLALVVQGEHCTLTVKDAGQGIPEDFLPHVFDAFKQADAGPSRKHGGLGLGLAIVQHLAQAHGGTITAESAGLGKGATFVVRLALARPDADAPEAPITGLRAALPSSLAGLRVLVVDDEADTRDLLVALFLRCEAQVTSATEAEEAYLAILGSHHDVLVSDVAMPGQDGYQLIKRLRAVSDERVRRIPAIAVTAYVRAEDRERALASGFDLHMAKPIDPARLVAAVASLAHTQH